MFFIIFDRFVLCIFDGFIILLLIFCYFSQLMLFLCYCHYYF